MQKIKLAYKLLLLCFIVCFLTGCWDRKELEDKAYVIAIGLDKSKEEKKIKITMVIANPEVGSIQGGGGTTEKPKEIITFDANDMITAKGTANAVISRSISYELLKIIVVSEEFAKEPDFIHTMYDTTKDREIRMNSYLAISKEKAFEYFKANKPRMEIRPHKYFQFMIQHGIENGLIPDSTLFRFFKTTERGNDLFLAMYTTAKRQENPKIKGEDEFYAGELNATGELDNTQFIGSAVLKNGRLIGKLSGQETRTVNILDDTTEIEDVLINFPNPFSNNSAPMSTRILKTENNKVKMNVKNGQTKIWITIPLSMEILANPSMVDFKKEKNQQILKEHLTKHFTSMIDSLFEKSQTDLKGAPYPLSLFARKYFATVQSFDAYDWPKAFTEADIHIQLQVDIIDFGKQGVKPKKMGG
nr:Ger(x)C family spore germination protein [uncultured Bacillus sp.]